MWCVPQRLGLETRIRDSDKRLGSATRVTDRGAYLGHLPDLPPHDRLELGRAQLAVGVAQLPVLRVRAAGQMQARA